MEELEYGESRVREKVQLLLYYSKRGNSGVGRVIEMEKKWAVP